MYGMKMMARALGVPFEFSCTEKFDGIKTGASFLMQLNELDMGGTPLVNRVGTVMSPVDVCDMCGGHFCSWYSNDLDLATPYMISDWKYLSREMNDLDHDDVVIHLRLGDGLKSISGENQDKGVYPHATYIHLIEEARREKGHISSIGIVAAPFKGNASRPHDRANKHLSEMITIDLLEHLQQAFPNVEVRLHNRPESTVMEALARIVHARKAAICGCSTFCLYPLMATNGIGYIHNPMRYQNLWVRNAAEKYDHIRLFETPMLNGLIISNAKSGQRLPDDRVMRWVREQDMGIGNVDIMEEPIFRYRD